MWSYFYVVLTAIADACLFGVLCIIGMSQDMDLQVTSPSEENDMALVIFWQSYVVMNGIMLSLMHFVRVRAISNSVTIFNLSLIIFFFISLAFALEDEYLSGVKMLFSCRNLLIFLILVAIYLGLRLFTKLVIEVVFPHNMQKIQKYIEIEERLYKEDLESSGKQFYVSTLPNYS